MHKTSLKQVGFLHSYKWVEIVSRWLSLRCSVRMMLAG
jgi:hypothetical protein